jgi:hypothetical protein
MRADPASASGQFSQGLLDPDLPLMDGIEPHSTRRFGVYRNNVTVGLVRAMEANFPVVRRLLGERYFEGFARAFVQSYPPRSPLMFLYGDAFCNVLAEDDDLSTYPYLPDIARLEQQVRVSYHEADAATISASELASIEEGDLMQAIFKPHPAMAVVSSAFAIHSIYSANRADVPEQVEDPAEPQSVLVTRPKYEVVLNKITRGQLSFLQNLVSGHPLGAAAEVALASDEDFDLTSAISMMLMSGAFQSIQIGNNKDV